MRAKRRTSSAGSANLSRFLFDRNLNQAHAAKAIGISRSSLSNYLGGRRRPSSAHAIAIALYTGGEVTPVSWLTNRDRRDVSRVRSEPARPEVSGE